MPHVDTAVGSLTQVDTDVPTAGSNGDGRAADGADGADGEGGEGGVPAVASAPRLGGGARRTDGTESRSGARLVYNPALDGIRGIAVLAVLLFHGGFAWARGGYLGVSTFFTLSGFLITSLLVGERLQTGRIRLTAFWARRARRLLPASAFALMGIAASALLVTEAWERSLRGDVLAALGQVINWRFILEDRAYGDLFASPSPVLHFWSLAIEEQFYLLFPLLAGGIFLATKRSPTGSLRLLGVLAVLLAGSALATFAVGADRPTTVYYATPIRMGEILVGALLAVVVARRGLPGGALARRGAAAAGVAALVVSVWAWSVVGQTSPRLYEGGLLAYALVSGALVLAATVPGPVRWVLSIEPLRLLGLVSYGVYLYHWPIFLLLNRGRTDLDGWPLFALRTAVTLGLAVASYVLVERPIRQGWRPGLPRVRMPALAGGAVAAVAATAVAVPVVSAPPADTFQDFAPGAAIGPGGPEAGAPGDGAPAADGIGVGPDGEPIPPDIPVSAALGIGVGDSTMWRTVWGLNIWGRDTGRLRVLGGAGGIGCGLTRGGERFYEGEVTANDPVCDVWDETLPETVATVEEHLRPVEFAVLQTGPWEVADRWLPGDDERRAPGDPVFDAFLQAELVELTDLLLDLDVQPVWLTAPDIDVGRRQEPPPPEPYPESDPARMRRLNQIIRDVVAERPGAVLIDLAGVVNRLPADEDERLRPDGVHFETHTATEVAEAWLGQAVLAAVEGRPAPPAPEAELSADSTGR